MQGVPYINSAKFTYAKVIWVILLLGAIGAMTFHLYYLCSQFFLWPKISKIVLNFSNLELPEVTICNNNVIKKSKFHMASRKLQELLLDLQQVKRKKRLITDSWYPPDILDAEDSAEDILFLGDEHFHALEGFGPLSETSVIEKSFRQLFMDHDRDTRVAMGHNISDMLFSCSFSGRECYADNFTLFTTSHYGNCYTLPSDKFIAMQSGPSRGLQLVLNLEMEEYLHGITQGYGARISLKDRNQIPFPADDGFFISAFSESDVGLKLVQIERSGPPYGICEAGVQFETRYKRSYSRQACQKMWEQDYIIHKCGCFNEEHEGIFMAANISNSHSCRSKAEKKCLSKYEADVKTKQVSPTCENPCNENEYTRQLSSRQWPTESHLHFLLEGVCKKQPHRCNSIPSKDSLNFAKVNLYYEDLNFEKISEEPEIENAQFLSDVGGAVGLWIGLSMLSLFEVVQLCVELCAFGVNRCKKSGEMKEKKRMKQKAKKQKERDNQKLNYAVNQIEFGHHSDIYDHIKSNNGYRENVYNYLGPSSQRGYEYQTIDDYFIYKGPQKI